MAELREAGVYSTTPEGAVFCRRLLRDKAASDLGSHWGRTGGNPQLKPVPPQPPEGAGEGLTAPASQPLKHQEAEAESSLTAFGRDSDARTHLFNAGLLFLKRVTGRPDRSARALLGKWLKMLADDAATLLAVLAECEAFNPAEPVSWLEATIRHRLAAQSEAAQTETTQTDATSQSTHAPNTTTPAAPVPTPHAKRMTAWAAVPDLEGV